MREVIVNRLKNEIFIPSLFNGRMQAALMRKYLRVYIASLSLFERYFLSCVGNWLSEVGLGYPAAKISSASIDAEN